MKRKFFSAVLIGFLMVFVAATAFAQQSAGDKVHKWKFQLQWPASSTSYKPFKEFLEQKVKNLTGGRLQISCFPGGAIVPTKEIFDSSRKGMIEGGVISPGFYASIIPLTNVSSNCPMTFRNPWEGLYFHFVLGFEDMLKAEHAKHGLLYYTEKMYPTALICKKPVRKIEEFKGLKIRSFGALAAFLKNLGAATSNIPGPEVYLALQTGVVDGAHYGAAGGALTLKFCEVAKYYIQPDLVSATAEGIVVNKAAFDTLPKDVQITFDLALKERAWHRSHEYIMDEVDALETMKRAFKVQVTTIPPEDQKKMAKVAMKQWDEAASKDAVSAKAVGMLKDFMRKLGHID